MRVAKGVADTFDELLNTLFATPLRVTDAEYVDARLLDVTVVLLQVIDEANVPDVIPEIFARVVSEDGLNATGPAV